MRDNHPPHLYLDDTWYLITASTIGHQPIFRTDDSKILLRNTLRDTVREFAVSLLAWVILDNHYHLLLKTRRGSDLPKFFRQLHGVTAHNLNKSSNTSGRHIWHNYFDRCIRGEADLWCRFNYIHQNPVKHGYVQELAEWPFSSYHYYLRTKGAEWLADCWQRYPVTDFSDGEPDF